MSGYEVVFYPEAVEGMRRLDNSQRRLVLKAIEKVGTGAVLATQQPHAE